MPVAPWKGLKATQLLDRGTASCIEQPCEARCDAKNATAWAHQHAKKTGHTVMLEMSYFVKVRK